VKGQGGEQLIREASYLNKINDYSDFEEEGMEKESAQKEGSSTMRRSLHQHPECQGGVRLLKKTSYRIGEEGKEKTGETGGRGKGSNHIEGKALLNLPLHRSRPIKEFRIKGTGEPLLLGEEGRYEFHLLQLTPAHRIKQTAKREIVVNRGRRMNASRK